MTDRSDNRLSRRGFLQAAGGTLAATSLSSLGPPAIAQVPNVKLPELPGKQVGFALVGLGSLAINQLMPAFARCRQAKLVGFVSGRPEKAKHLAQVYGVDPKNIYTYDTYERLADNPAIDVVYVVLPNSMHAEYTIRAVKAGKHVLCEKPMANTPQDCEQMIAAAKAANRKLMIGYRVRYEPYNQALIAYARESADAGPTRIILADAGFNIGDPTQWRLRKQMAGGGSLMDIGIYAECRALSLRRGAGGGERDDALDAERPAVRRGRGEHHVPAPLPERHPRQLHLQLRRELQPVPRDQAARVRRARPRVELHRPADARLPGQRD